jgi:Glycosyltransferase family 92
LHFLGLDRFWRDAAFRRSWRYRVPQSRLLSSVNLNLYLATATIVFNEAKYIREFVCFHRLVGVDRMLIYMDGGIDSDVCGALADFVQDGFVELIPWPRFIKDRNNQFLAYQHASQYMFGRAKWLAMIDADEFLFAPESGDLIGELRKREHFAALSVYSRTFGTGRVKKIEKGGFVIESLTKRAKLDHLKNRTQRTIARPEMISAIRSANTCVLAGTDCLGWDEDGRPVYATGETGHGCAKLRINHYFTRAEEDFRAKLARQYFGKGNLAEKMSAKALEAEGDVLSTEDDPILHRYLPELKALYGQT